MPAPVNDIFEAGVFLVDKPPGISSFKVVSKLRRILQIKKVGHAGTLDPFATGLLIVCAGRPATKIISQFMGGEKEYLVTLRLGIETETYDTEGEVVSRSSIGCIPTQQFETALEKFRGKQLQVPPAYSALKHKGKPLYYYARKGIKIEKEPREIDIAVLERIDRDKVVTDSQPLCKIKVVCSKGTYIRTLGFDLGRELGCGAHLQQLRRTRIGPFSLEGSLTWDQLNAEDCLQQCLGSMLSVEQAGKLLQ